MERAKGIEPSCEAWKASVLPLNYARLRCASARQARSQFSEIPRHVAPKLKERRRTRQARSPSLQRANHNARACLVNSPACILGSA